ncbi:hypothetical protein BO71DRAFT_435883 [Aspergillus ellipticus CBS 707.79]|uniref:Pyrroline-5-carboxylate reductase catalytic N-terminal domain-containing protein n=1 Tax=Aspergillus ellipticus CBS 707.79 TaxID=1448320 RepID=A0A319CSK0_9EURO|nr:hypothetical protein BO71DRAFT_435883 [Aspergillus ellipticus CBS 707.79]
MSSPESTLSIIGCGNMGTAILDGLLSTTSTSSTTTPLPTTYIATVKTQPSLQTLQAHFATHLPPTTASNTLTLLTGPTSTTTAIQNSNTIILAIPPPEIPSFLATPDLPALLAGKLLISIAAGWIRIHLPNPNPALLL